MSENIKAGTEEGKPQKTPFKVRFAIFMLFVTAVVFLPSTIVFSICMIPTLVAAIVDNNYQKTAWLTVGAMNLAGTVPAWFSLWDTGHTIPGAFNLVMQPETLLIAYGGAFIGWVIYNNITPVVAALVLNKNERRLRAIDKRQKELVKKWGEEVVS
jgi:hypothetical protein